MSKSQDEKPAEVVRGAPVKYPWDEWMNGKWWTVKQGEDFHITPANFRVSLHQKARTRGMKVQTSIVENEVMFQFTSMTAR